jgi:hypothetical protein
MSQEDRDIDTVALLKEIRNWLNVGFYPQAKKTLAEMLPDEKTRRAYQLADGTHSQEYIRKAVGMSPNRLLAVFRSCTQQGLMDELPDKKRLRRFDLADFNLLSDDGSGAEPQTQVS